MLFISCHCEDVATTYIVDRLVSSLHSWCGKLFFLKIFADGVVSLPVTIKVFSLSFHIYIKVILWGKRLNL